MTIISIFNYEGDGLSRFDCGNEELNNYLVKYARQNEHRGFGRTYLAIEGDEIIGYFTLSACQSAPGIVPAAISKRWPRYPIPGLRIARMAVAKTRQRQGYGRLLLLAALKRIVPASETIGMAVVVVEPKPEAEGFYRRFGFIPVEEVEGTFVIPLASLMKEMLAN